MTATQYYINQYQSAFVPIAILWQSLDESQQSSSICLYDGLLSGGTSNYALVTLSNVARALITGTTIKDSPTTVLER